MNVLVKCLAPVCLSFMLAAGCSSSDSSTPPAASADAGAPGDAASPMMGDASTGSDAAALPDASPSNAACAYAVSGDRMYPTTDAFTCPGYLKQVNGMGDYTINVAAGFMSSTMENVTLGFTVSAATPPAAGDTWTLGQNGHDGSLTLTITQGQTGTIWSTSDTDSAMVKGGTIVTFQSVTKMNGTQRPQDVYYLFEVTLETALVGRTAGATATKVTGHFKATSLPLGS